MNLAHRLAVAVAVTLVPVAARATSYPMMCRGGSYTHQVSAGVFGGVDGYRMGLYTTFSKAPGSSGSGAGLAPGQCAWLDRAISPGEPSRLVSTDAAVSNFYVQFTFGPSWPAINGQASAFGPAPMLAYLKRLRDPTDRMIFCVRSLLPSNQAFLIESWGNLSHRCS